MSIKYDHENLQFHERELNEFDKKDWTWDKMCFNFDLGHL